MNWQAHVGISMTPVLAGILNPPPLQKCPQELQALQSGPHGIGAAGSWDHSGHRWGQGGLRSAQKSMLNEGAPRVWGAEQMCKSASSVPPEKMGVGLWGGSGLTP